MDANSVRGRQFIKYLSPARATLLGLVIFLLLVAIAPLDFDLSFFSAEALAFIALSLIGFWLGCAVAAKSSRSAVWQFTDVLTSGQVGHLILITLGLGAFGTLLRAYDRFILRGFEFSESVIWARESIQSDVSMFGYLGGVLFPLSMACLVLHWLDGGRRPVTLLAATAFAAYPLVEALAVGSRSTFLNILFLIAFCAAASGRLRMSHVLMVSAALSVPLLLASQALYESRSMEVGYQSIIEIYILNSITLYAPPQDWITSLIGIEGSFFVDTIVRPWLHLSQYATSTWLVFMDNFASFSGNFGWGQIHFYVPFKALSVVFDLGDGYDPLREGMKQGLFSTAFSTIYYDFGWFGPAVTFAFGYASTRLQAMAIREPHCWLLLYAVVVFACTFAFIENQLLSSYFLFAVWSFLLYGVIGSLWSRLSRERARSGEQIAI